MTWGLMEELLRSVGDMVHTKLQLCNCEKWSDVAIYPD